MSNPACSTAFITCSAMGFSPSTVRILAGLAVSTCHLATLGSALRKGVTARRQLAQLMLVLNCRDFMGKKLRNCVLICVAPLLLKLMAIYQAGFSLIPKQAVLDKYGRIPPRLIMTLGQEDWPVIESFDSENLDTVEYEPEINWWQNGIEAKHLKNALERVIAHTPETEYSPTMLHFGSYNGNDAIICFDAETGQIEEAGIRLDLRQDLDFLLNQLIICCKDLDLLLLSKDGELIQPDKRELTKSIKHSSAFSFLTNPDQFLAGLFLAGLKA